RSREELLDLVQDRLGVAREDQMVVARQLDQLRAWDALRQVAAATDLEPAVAAPMEDEGRHADRGQKLADVDLQRHLQDPACRGRARAQTQILRPPPAELLVVGEARRPDLGTGRPAPVL